MRNTDLAQRPALAAALLAIGALMALVLLWDADSLLSRLMRLDLSFLAFPLAWCGVLLAIGRFALWLRSTELAERVTWRLRVGGGTPRVIPLTAVLPVAERLLTDLAWAALGLGLLLSVPTLPGVVSGHPWTPDIASLAPYLGGFSSLAVWSIFLVAPFIAARAVAEVRSPVREIVDFPWVPLSVFGRRLCLAGLRRRSLQCVRPGRHLGTAGIRTCVGIVLRRCGHPACHGDQATGVRSETPQSALRDRGCVGCCAMGRGGNPGSLGGERIYRL